MSEVKVNKISPRTNCGTVTVGDSGDSVSVTAGVPVTVNGDLKSNALKATDGGSIISQSGTTVTIGASGDTVSLASGASQTGFGRTGTVDWQTSIKTSTITVVNGEGYFVNTTGGAITANLPAGSAGAIVSFRDYANTFDSNALTIDSNGSEKINGSTDDLIVSTEGEALTLVYADATKGWLVVNDGNNDAGVQAEFVTATGGTITCCGNFKIHTFTGPGTFTVSNAGNTAGSNSVDYLVVAGGGSGGASNGGGGGGGAGGFRLSNSTCMPAPLTSPLASATGVTVTAQGYPVVIGAGGASVTGAGPSPQGVAGNNGNNSSALGITSTAGGGGGGSGANSTSAGKPGGSGGGEGGQTATGGPGSGNTPPVSPPQGNDGGNTNPGLDTNQGSGGGGAGAAGDPNLSTSQAGPGGIGSFVVATGFAGTNGTTGPVSSTRYFAGGGGANSEGEPAPKQGQGGAGGGAPGGQSGSGAPDGTANTGGAGGGIDSSPAGQTSGIGGSGIVIIRYKFQ